MRMLIAECTTSDRVRKKSKKLQGQCLRMVSPESPAKLYCCYAVIAVLTVAVIVLSVALSLSGNICAFCPRHWIGVGGKCFYFSEKMANWTSSQTSCMAQGAQLAQFDDLEQLNFLKRFKGDSDCWIGLHRESSGHPWMWTDNTDYNNLTSIRGEGECAYLIIKGISSGRNYTHRNWICSKPYSYASIFTACAKAVIRGL
ncbi:C-type lectin domain family 2 member H [Phodopus roborovskii]|uniref:C-type lectin domain family 2 member H n=1 Tax=Phodopus roborovskii TaxID=109678 RepID=UPI0021E4E790|nr:C-type lectin domain family 2 member H [Phodopus roborovskii]